jgi:GT2 family glycosyltransferase
VRPSAERFFHVRIVATLLHYRFWPDVRPALDALFAQTRPADSIVVVDNGSGDGSANLLRAHYPRAEVVEVAENQGPIGGYNLAFEAGLARGADAVLKLNHDCELAPTALERLAERLEENSDVGVVGPLLGRAVRREEVWSAGGIIHPRTWHLDHIVQPDTVSGWDGRPPHPVEWLEGSAALTRADAIRATGRLYEGFFALFEEADYHMRMRSLGWRVECVPAAVAWQEPGSYSPYLGVRNQLGFVARNAPRRYVARELARTGWHVLRDAVRPSAGAPRSELPARMRGVLDFARGRWGPPPPGRVSGV